MATEKQWVSSFCTWLKRFDMDKGYQVRFYFNDTGEVKIHGSSYLYQAGTTSLPEYRDHEVNVNKSWLHGSSHEEMDETACHEAIHLITSQTHHLAETIIAELPKAKQEVYFDWYRRENEEVTTHLTSVLVFKAKGWNK